MYFLPNSLTGLCFIILRLLFANQSNLEEPFTAYPCNYHVYEGHQLCFNIATRQSLWVGWSLSKTEATTKAISRATRFYPDPFFPDDTASDSDYKGSGLDRGHLTPAADMRYSAQAMKDCFYYSNISPQHPSVNRGIWADLESLTRKWATQFGIAYITTGPLFTDKAPRTIGVHKIPVPDAFYKAILIYPGKDFSESSMPPVQAIAFIIPNSPTKEPLKTYACTIDDVEKNTGFNFFPGLPDIEESIIESSLDLTAWNLEDTSN